MSCPDWQTLVAAREAAFSATAATSGSAPEADPPGWAEARSHAAYCGRCREAALAADPLLLFTRLPERTVTPAEIGDMQSAVAALVRASRVGQGEAQRAALGPDSLRNRAAGLLTATRVAAALGICSLLALSGVPRATSPAGESLAGTFAATTATAANEMIGMPGALGQAPNTQLDSAVEELDRPGARIYELPQPDMAVVMIVDASLDV